MTPLPWSTEMRRGSSQAKSYDTAIDNAHFPEIIIRGMPPFSLYYVEGGALAPLPRTGPTLRLAAVSDQN